MAMLGNPNPGSPMKLADRVRTMCKVCRHAIVYDERAVWCRNPLGLVHGECMPGGAR